MSQDGANWIMALYAFQLLTGNNLMCNQIKSATANKYCRDVAKFLLRFRDDDPRKIRGSDNLCPQLKRVLDSALKWENVKDKREPLTIKMIQARDVTALPMDCLASAIHDWCVIGLHGGFRGSEWCQMKDAKNKQLGHSQQTKFPRPYRGRKKPRFQPLAFCLCDLKFVDVHNKTIKVTRKNFDQQKQRINHIFQRYKEQKNGDDGETKRVTRNDTIPDICPVRAWIRVVERFFRCYPASPFDQPLAIHKLDDQYFHIFEHEVNTEFQLMAQLAYDLDPNDAEDKVSLRRFTTHSLRVGACVILHAKNCSPADIKRILRWRSDSYLDYLRDLHFVAARQNEALINAFNNPDLF